MSNSPVAVITGASRGLGFALARALAGTGYSLVIDAREEAPLRAAAAALAAGQPAVPAGAAAPAVVALPGDIADPAHRAALRAAAADLGGPSLLVNNAGTLGASPLPALADYPVAALRESFEVNVIAPVALTQLLLPDLRRVSGAVLSITSDAAVEAYAGWGGYGAAKAALEQACNVLAAEEAAVRVWWVDPGDLRTRMHQAGLPRRGHLRPPAPRGGHARLPAAAGRADAQRPVPGRRPDARGSPPMTVAFTLPPAWRPTSRPRRGARPGTTSR